MTTQSQQATTPNFSIERMYVKDLSFESPNTPFVFQEEWKPQVNLDLKTNSQEIEDNFHEVILSLTVTVTTGEKNAFLVELHYGSIFMLKDFPEQQLNEVLGCICPNMIYPYAREVISDAIVRAGFPPLYLAPVNFEALYLEEQKKAQENAKTSTQTDANTTTH